MEEEKEEAGRARCNIWRPLRGTSLANLFYKTFAPNSCTSPLSNPYT